MSMMRWTMGLLLVANLGCQDDEASLCGQGESLQVADEVACVYQDSQAIIENGFRCPPERSHRQEVENRRGERMVVCSAKPVDPNAVLAARGDEPVEPEPEPEARPEPEAPEPEAPEPEPQPEPQPEPRPEPEPDPQPDPGPRGEPEPDPEPDPVVYPQDGEQCSIVAEPECDRNPCWACAGGLECVPHADEEAPRGRCTPQRAPAPVGAMCEPGDHLSCAQGQGCDAFQRREGTCQNICGYGTYDCEFGSVCRSRGTVCSPSPFEITQFDCVLGGDDCAEGTGCHLSADDGFVQNANWRFLGAQCSPLNNTADFAACDFSDDCGGGSACMFPGGAIDDGQQVIRIFAPALNRPIQHPVAARTRGACMPVCGTDLPACGEGLTCHRIANAQDQPEESSVLVQTGVCGPN